MAKNDAYVATGHVTVWNIHKTLLHMCNCKRMLLRGSPCLLASMIEVSNVAAWHLLLVTHWSRNGHAMGCLQP